MPRFFVNENQISKKDNLIRIIGNDVNHIKNVLRLKVNDDIDICSKETSVSYYSKISEISEKKVVCKIEKVLEEQKEPDIYINVIQALPKADKMELIIQKTTELGVKEITPINLKRCVVKIDSKDEPKKLQKWKSYAESAAKQCGRNIIPKINSICNINNVFEILKDYDIVFVAYENENKNSLKHVIKNINKKDVKIALVIGPEGGIENSEVEFFQNNGAISVSLGGRILRTETVSFVLTSILMYEFGDLGGRI
ncbi:MAG: 16S rRNA (uracil(1498)-N(3))-methyltransferase [Lachnospiraceae bacterium]|jgi:16S rRNA (uracil1498-N3)-methyltransferase|nr:16S rRNA (uracil(1498)-N(3))-methyltransferase [Lachnospiraceae bacterium]